MSKYPPGGTGEAHGGACNGKGGPETILEKPKSPENNNGARHAPPLNCASLRLTFCQL
jgi:hypothetical protein